MIVVVGSNGSMSERDRFRQALRSTWSAVLHSPDSGSVLVLPVDPEEWRTTIGSSLASSKVFPYGYGVVFPSPSSIS